ncbi:MAG: histidine phosphatase family protein [Alphaproteobacteria bacterium]|nr:histidine phosphatase family protein [Alphaproteobacteria bacterium]
MRISFDGLERRRIYFFRHGDVTYMKADGSRVADSREVVLTERGKKEADAKAEMFRLAEIDRAICSGLPRTRETAERVLRHHNIEIEDWPEFEEIRSGRKGTALPSDLARIAYAFAGAHEPGALYGEGDAFEAFERRIVGALTKVLSEPGWTSLALFAHGGVNRVILGWATGAGLRSFPVFEQDTCCLNILDVDQEPSGGPVRRVFVRGVNITAYDPLKIARDHTTLEGLAMKMRDAGEGAGRS